MNDDAKLLQEILDAGYDGMDLAYWVREECVEALKRAIARAKGTA